MIRTLGVACLICLSPPMRAQSFEVASVKLHAGPVSIINITVSGPRFRASANYVGGLILYAYNLKNYQLAWADPNSSIGELTFDIEAKAEGDLPRQTEEFRHMVQTLLADRFKLHFHREMRELPVYALVVGKSGAKFKESPPEAIVSGRHTVNGRNQIMNLTRATMEDVVQQLPVYTGRPVIDKTGLTAMYDLRMEATPLFRINRDPDPTDISVFVAVQDQLGLKLESQKASVEVPVIDHVEKPSGN